MGPRMIRRGKLPHTPILAPEGRASMGPRMSNRGKTAGPNPFPHNRFQRALRAGFSRCDIELSPASYNPLQATSWQRLATREQAPEPRALPSRSPRR